MAASRGAEIPGPSGLDMLRGISLMRRHPPGFLRQCELRHGSVVSFPIPRRTVVFVADPVDVRRVLQQNHVGYGKRTIQYDALATVTGMGLLASDGQLWRRLRRLEQPAFHTNLVEGMVGQIIEPTDRLIAALATTFVIARCRRRTRDVATHP